MKPAAQQSLLVTGSGVRGSWGNCAATVPPVSNQTAEMDDSRLLESPAPTPETLATRGRLGAFVKWSRTTDRTAATRAARSAFMARFEREVDPTRSLPFHVRTQMAEAARRAYFVRLALIRSGGQGCPLPPIIAKPEGAGRQPTDDLPAKAADEPHERAPRPLTAHSAASTSDPATGPDS